MRLQTVLESQYVSADLNAQIIEFDALCERIRINDNGNGADLAKIDEVDDIKSELIEKLAHEADRLCSLIFDEADMDSGDVQEYYVDKMAILSEKIRINLSAYFYAHQIEEMLSSSLNESEGLCH